MSAFNFFRRTGSRVLEIAAPAMRRLAEAERINVGLAAADRDEMVYLESIRYSRRVALRTVVSGQRVPIELTSLGRAYLSTLPEAARKPLYAAFRARRRAQWPGVLAGIQAAMQRLQAEGFCAASWQPEVVALATPLRTTDATYVLNVSTLTEQDFETAVEQLRGPLLKLKADLQAQIDAWSAEAP